MKKLTTKEFIKRASVKHNKVYDYSLVEYKKNSTKIIIICLKHGEFKQTPATHLRGYGCSKCRYDKLHNLHVLTKEEYLKKIIEKHGEKFDYSLVNYQGMHKPVQLVCKEHGLLEKKAQAFLTQKTGCKQCGVKALIKNKKEKFTTEVFIKKSQLTWGSLYDYSLVSYQGEKKPITLICPIHGKFEVTPNTHLYSQRGCSSCTNVSKGEIVIETFLKEKKINYKKQKTFKECKDKKQLRFDFYLPDYNICIEFDGIFHYKPYKNNQSSLKKSIKRDKIKNKFCKDNNIKLLRIPYWEFKEIIPILTLNLK